MLKTEVSEVKAEMAEMKTGLAEMKAMLGDFLDRFRVSRGTDDLVRSDYHN